MPYVADPNISQLTNSRGVVSDGPQGFESSTTPETNDDEERISASPD